jgi:hypothetical protein
MRLAVTCSHLLLRGTSKWNRIERQLRQDDDQPTGAPTRQRR